MTTGLRPEQTRGFIRPRRDEIFADEFHAVPNGKDVTTQLNAALVRASSEGRTLVIPPGTYRCVDVVVPANTRLRGFGPFTTLKRVAGGAGVLSNVLRITGSNVEISDLTLDGNGGEAHQADNRGVIDGFTADVENIKIERCRITNAGESGFRYLDLGSTLKIYDCEFDNISESAIFIGQTTQDGENVDISRVHIDGCTSGVQVRGSNDGTTWFMRQVTINTVHVKNATALCVESWCEDATISDVTTIGGTFGISNGPGAGTTITGCSVRGATTIGIEAAAAINSSNSTCVGNRVDGAGISASDTADKVVISDNEITCPSGEVPIHTINCDRVEICGNMITADTGCAYSIRVQSGRVATVNDNQIDHGTPNGGLGDNGIFFGDVEEITCGDNKVENHTYGIRLNSATAVYVGTITGNNLIGNTTHYNEALSGSSVSTALHVLNNTPEIFPHSEEVAHGEIGRFSATSNSSAYTGTDQNSDMVINDLQVYAHRLYKVHFHSMAGFSNNADHSVFLKVDGTDTERLAFFAGEATGADRFLLDTAVLWEPTTGVKDLVVASTRNAGTATITFEASGAVRRWFWVEDVGVR